MLKNILIKNFKSIKKSELECGRINVFIGEPNSGKTNILEAISLLSIGYSKKVENIIRFEDFSNLFYDNDIRKKVELNFKSDNKYGDYQNPDYVCDQKVTIEFSDDFKIISEGQILGCNFNMINSNNKFSLNIISKEGSPIKYYDFKKYKVYDGKELDFIYPPNGKNLYNILQTNSDLREYAKNLFENYGYNILLEQESKKIKIAKIFDGILISQPFYTVADTLQRMLFYSAIIETNKDSSIIIDEPDVYLFPKYTKYLAERIAKYNTNQFFFSTHNPYFLLTLAEKTPVEDLRIFLTYFEDYQTKVKLLNKEEVLNLREDDANFFFNIENYKD